MTRLKINYNNAIIYKIVCRDLNIKDCYVGSTTDFRKRKWAHKYNCNNDNHKKYNYKVYKYIRENGGWGNWDMIEIEKYQCNDGNELRARERHYYEMLNANLNSGVPNRSQKEYYKEYAKEYEKTDKRREYKKEYQKTDKYKEYAKEYEKIKIICKCGSMLLKHYNARHLRTNKHQRYYKTTFQYLLDQNDRLNKISLEQDLIIKDMKLKNII